MKVSFGYTEGVKWPNAKPFLVRLVEGSGRAQWDNGKRLLTVKLPKADVATARVSSYLLTAQGDVDRLGMLRWLEEATVDADTLAAFRQQVADGPALDGHAVARHSRSSTRCASRSLRPRYGPRARPGSAQLGRHVRRRWPTARSR